MMVVKMIACSRAPGARPRRGVAAAASAHEWYGMLHDMKGNDARYVMNLRAKQGDKSVNRSTQA